MAGLHFLKIIWKGRCKILIMCENSCKFRRLTVLFFGNGIPQMNKFTLACGEGGCRTCPSRPLSVAGFNRFNFSGLLKVPERAEPSLPV